MNTMYNKKMIAMMLTLSMLAASLAGCAGGDDDDDADWAISMASDVEVVWVESGWDPIIPNLNAGEMCDVIISAMTKTEARDQVVDFTRAYYTSSQGVIGGSGSASISDVSELNAAGITVGVQSGTTSDIFANGDADNMASLPDATVVAYEDFPSVIAALDNGDVMYALGDAPVLSLEGTLMTQFSDENFGFAVREDSGELLDALNVAIGAIVDSGEYDTIFQASFDGAAVLADDTTTDTATAYPASPSEGSTLTGVLESGQLKVCTDPFYPPFESYDADNNVVGFDADVAHAVVDEIAAHYMGTANPVFVAPVVATTIKIGFLNDATGPISQFAGAFTFAWNAAKDDLNAMGDEYVFEVVEADSGCDGQMAATAAQSLVDAGVVGVAGAACSGASIGANAVLSAAGIPMISYASTSPSLSSDENYPHFYRIVPSDAYQAGVMSEMVSADGHTNPAIIHMVNAYGAGLADAFIANWDGDVCLQAGYDEQVQVDFQAQVQSVIDAGCDSVVLGSYSADGALIVETMAGMGAVLPTYSADGMAGENALADYTAPAAANGLKVTRPASDPASAAPGGEFAAACAAAEACSGGIYQNEAYDTVMMLGHAAMHEDGANMATHIEMVGNGYQGESGTHTFEANGEVPGLYYDVCTFHHVPTYGEYFNCDRGWNAEQGIHDVTWAGATVKIGFLNDATGPIAVYAGGFVAASQIALGLANTIGYSNGVQFEIVYADSGCDGTMGATAAQTLVDAGAWGVVGAACSGASQGANAILAAANIPQVSYASTSPTLESDENYPGFFRVVPSDAYQGSVMAEVVAGDGYTNVAVFHMVNAYGAGLADTFVQTIGSENVCTQVGYDEQTQVDHSAMVQSAIDNNCDSVFMVSYAADGAAIIEELETQGFSGQIYGGDGIAEEGLGSGMADNSTLSGIIASKPHNPNPMGDVGMLFASLCNANPACADGIYTAEAFDAVTIVAFAAFTALATPNLTAELAVMGTGQGWNGASGTISFLTNGDIIPAGFCIGEFSVTTDATDGVNTVSYDCARYWDPENGITTATA